MALVNSVQSEDRIEARIGMKETKKSSGDKGIGCEKEQKGKGEKRRNAGSVGLGKGLFKLSPINNSLFVKFLSCETNRFVKRE